MKPAELYVALGGALPRDEAQLVIERLVEQRSDNALNAVVAIRNIKTTDRFTRGDGHAVDTAGLLEAAARGMRGYGRGRVDMLLTRADERRVSGGDFLTALVAGLRSSVPAAEWRERDACELAAVSLKAAIVTQLERGEPLASAIVAFEDWLPMQAAYLAASVYELLALDDRQHGTGYAVAFADALAAAVK